MKTRKAVIRKNAVPVYVYNEGLVVYLYDEANSGKLKSLLEKLRLTRNDFFSNLNSKEFREIVEREALCAAYTLDQDDPVSAEVGTGKELSSSELSIARWMEPQHSMLSLPSGLLRIDTPNTIPLDPEPPNDPGVIVKVPPGDYRLTLYRVDWEEMRRAGIKKKVPGEFILLTRVSEKKKAIAQAILEFPLRQDKDWIKNFQVEQKQFQGKVYFYGYWEGFYLNMERAAARKLRLRSGDRLRINTERLKIDGLFLGDFLLHDFLGFYGKAEIEKRMNSFKEFAFGEWSKADGRQILLFKRQKGTRQVIERHLDTWIPAEVIVLPEKWVIPDPAEFGVSWINKNSVEARVLFATDLDASLNVKLSDLKGWDISHGKTMTLVCGNERRTVVFAESETKWDTFGFLTNRFPPQFESSLLSDKQHDGKFFAQKGNRDTYRGLLPVQWIAQVEQRPLVAYFQAMGGKEKFLRIRPMPVDGNSIPAPDWIREQIPPPPWSKTITRGANVMLSV